MNCLSIIIAMTLLSSCAMKPLLPATERKKSYEIINSNTKNEAYSKIVLWAAKNFNNAGAAVQLKDEAKGLIVAKTNIECEALKLGSGFAKNQRIEFILEIQTLNKLTKLNFENILGRGIAYDDGQKPSSIDELNNAFESCLLPIAEDIKAALIK